MTTTAAPDALFGAVSAVAAEVTGELAAVLARLGELTDAAVAAEATGDLEADAARIDQIATLERIQAAAAATQAALMVEVRALQVEAQQQAVPGATRVRSVEALPISSRWPAGCRRRKGRGGSGWRGRCTSSCHPRLRCYATAGSARTLPGSSRRNPVTSTRTGAEPSTVEWPPSWPTALHDGRRCWPGSTPTRPTRRATCSAGAPPVPTGRVGLRPAPDTMAILSGFLPSSRVWRAWRRCARTPTRSRTPAISAAATRSWRTPWLNGSPDRLPPPTSRPRWRSSSRSTRWCGPMPGARPRWSGTARFPLRWRRTS